MSNIKYKPEERKIKYAGVRKKRIEENPWIPFYYNIRTRCNCPSVNKYEYYGGAGIKCDITMLQLKSLWIRDNATLMEHPSIDRIDSSKDYTLENCRFREFSENRIDRRKTFRKHRS